MGQTCSQSKSITVASSLVQAVSQDITPNPSAVTAAPATTTESVFESDANLETYMLIWCDATVIANTAQNTDLLSRLRSIVNYVKTFDSASTCKQYVIQVESTKRIILISSATIAALLLSQIHALPQMYAVYVYGLEETNANDQTFAVYSKIRAILSTIDEAISRASADRMVRRQQYDDTATFQISLDNDYGSDVKPNLSATILWFQLLIDYIIRLSEGPSFPELIDICRKQYAGNVFDVALIEEFEDKYQSDKAIWWYTKESFVYRLLNQALRERNIYMMILFREYIRDLIAELAEKRYSDGGTITVYRGQALLVSEINRLRDHNSSLIIMQSFLSTSKNREMALHFAKQMVVPMTVNPVLFEVTADTQLKERPFADITRHSEFPGEEEILFSVGCVFKATSVIYSDNVWLIKLVLCKTDEYELNDVYSITKAALDTSIDLHAFELFLWNTGMSRNIPDEHPPEHHRLDVNNSKSLCLYADKVYRSDRFSSSSRTAATKWYLQAIDLELKSQPMNYLNLFKMYLKVSTCLKDDKIYYRKAKDIVSNLNKENDPPQTARLYFKLAQHWSPHDHIDLNEALDCYLACLHIQEETLPENDLNIALTCNAIAELHFMHLMSLDDMELRASLSDAYYSIQEFFVRKCLSIQVKALPAAHIELAFTYVRLGRLYIGSFQRNIALALENYEKALSIFQALEIDGTRHYQSTARMVNSIKSGCYEAPDGCW